ncbi:hypothetical protein L226DRAFT_534276 [Lentinus tigrinus ALCF2SS1-7]|uniref:Uncharacterized protein n=1 Tax=Lentinus tigrinus ALCF2SS1-6 TaxID=1328759 RepID=A0A5C2RP95_9APHY|nr:hypothetical protein L227DRAFT_581582 [Lentinus tigrinus ALCF2SS1-6]RPD75359.1 hypothetical protein L226DRAFT_534276 [Lentinus tigrinus ALCF2SS1-7]
MEPPPTILQELHDRDEVLYGFEISDELVAAYREKHLPPGVEMPNTVAAVIVYKFALLRSFAQDLWMDFVTLYSEKPRFFGRRQTRPNQEDMVYWASGTRGRCLTRTCPNPDKLKEFIRKLGIDVEPAWH